MRLVPNSAVGKSTFSNARIPNVTTALKVIVGLELQEPKDVRSELLKISLFPFPSTIGVSIAAKGLGAARPVGQWYIKPWLSFLCSQHASRSTTILCSISADGNMGFDCACM